MRIGKSGATMVTGLVAIVLMAGPAFAGTWSGLKVLEGVFGVSSPPEGPALAVNGTGHTVAAWNATGPVRFAEHLNAGNWTPSTVVVPKAESAGPVAVSIGADETTAVAWVTVATEFTPAKMLVTVRAPGGVFTTPVEAVPGASAGDLRLGVAGDGTVILLWDNATGVLTSTLPPHGTWSAPLMISGAGAGLPDLVVNDAGAALAVWQEGAPGSPTSIAGAYRTAGGIWRAPRVVSAGSGLGTWNPKPGIDAAGGVAVGYLDGNTMMVALKSVGHTWGAPVAVSGTQTAGYPALAMDRAGDVVAAWEALDAGNYGSIWESTLPAGGAWSVPERLSRRADDSSWPTAAFSSDGSLAVVTWVDNTAQKARASLGSAAGPWVRSGLGIGWWGSTVPVVAGAGTVTAAWAAPMLPNPNAARILARVFG